MSTCTCTCTCPPMRNGIDCGVHTAHLPVKTPIWDQLAWELDLNWATDHADRLFWQHDRLDGWPFPESARYCVQCHRGDRRVKMSSVHSVCDECRDKNVAWFRETYNYHPA